MLRSVPQIAQNNAERNRKSIIKLQDRKFHNGASRTARTNTNERSRRSTQKRNQKSIIKLQDCKFQNGASRTARTNTKERSLPPLHCYMAAFRPVISWGRKQINAERNGKSIIGLQDYKIEKLAQVDEQEKMQEQSRRSIRVTQKEIERALSNYKISNSKMAQVEQQEQIQRSVPADKRRKEKEEQEAKQVDARGKMQQAVTQITQKMQKGMERA